MKKPTESIFFITKGNIGQSRNKLPQHNEQISITAEEKTRKDISTTCQLNRITVRERNEQNNFLKFPRIYSNIY